MYTTIRSVSKLNLSRVTFSNNMAAIELGLKWRNEDARVKAHFIAMAKQAKAKHFLQHPNYQYRPRKPSEKKRRVNRRKMAASANAVNSESASSDKPVANSVEVLSCEEVALPVPEVPKNSAGNAMLELGDQDLDSKTFEKMVDEYNKSFPTQPSHVNKIVAEATTTPVIYDETCQDAQNDGNFFLAQQYFNPFEPNGLAGLDTIFDEPSGFEDLFAKEAEAHRQPKAIFDMVQEETTENMLARMSSAFDEDY